MCGIAAVLATPFADQQAASLVTRSLACLTHRGEPDFWGECWSMPGFAGGTNRLPFTSGTESQPASDGAGRYRVFLNGEIYSLHGVRDRSGAPKSDTRAFAEACLAHGVKRALADNNGMYALIVIDTVECAAYLARDPFGIKPLYFSRTDRGVLVASEIKALTCHDFVDIVEHVEPGSLLRISRDGSIEELHRLRIRPKSDDLDDEAFVVAFRDALARSVREQTRDAHRFAVYLSGGIDSSSVYALAKAAGVEVVPLVLGTAAASDVAAARAVAAHFGDTIETIPCPDEEDLFLHIEETIRICESFEPNVVRQSAVSRLLANGARARGCRVALCGEGADELLGGYPEFWRPGVHFDSVRQAFLRDLPRTQLQRVDRTNMASTIEVRVPFLSAEVASLALSRTKPQQFAASPGGRHAKLPLRKAMIDVLPKSIIDREKVVLSEGAGLRGNSPLGGMFSDIFQRLQPKTSFDPVTRKIWSLTTREECFYFSIFQRLGYDRYRQARSRVYANASATQDDKIAVVT